MTPYETTLVHHHEWGLHAERHPACPVCYRHEVAGTCTVDQALLFESVDAVGSVKDQADDWFGMADIREKLGEAGTGLDTIASRLDDARATIESLRKGLIDTLPVEVQNALAINEVYQDMLTDLDSDIVSAMDARTDVAECLDDAGKATTETEEQTSKFSSLATEAFDAMDKVQ